jgi:hypothetical protein
MLAFSTSPSEIALVLAQSDAKWLSDEMSFLTELYRSKAGASECQFGAESNPALASFLETAEKCQRLSVALQQAVRRGYRMEDEGPTSDQRRSPEPATVLQHPALPAPDPAISLRSAERPTQLKRLRQRAKPEGTKKTKRSSTRGKPRSKAKDPSGG